METNLERFKLCTPCTPCTPACFKSHDNQSQSSSELVRAPSFLKMISDKHLPNNAGFVRLPSTFMDDHGRRIGNMVTLKGPNGWIGQVSISYNEGFGFCGGWKQFVIHHNVEVGDYIVCTLIAESKFSVKIYNKFGCEKFHPSHAPSIEGSKTTCEKRKDISLGSNPLLPKNLEGGREFSLASLGGKRKTMDEVKSLSGIGKKLCMQQLGLDSSGVENGNLEVKTKPHFVLEKTQFNCDHDHDLPSPLNLDATRAFTPLQVGPISDDCSTSDSEKKSVEMEEIDDIGDSNKARRKRAHRAVYETEMRRFMAMEAAQAYETANPKTMLVVNKTAITKSQSYFSSVFARKWFPEERAQLLLIDDVDNKWNVTFIPTASHMVLGAGWAKFVRDNKLEKGDVVVFELKNPSTLTLVVHIFRVKDYTFVRVANLGKTKHLDSSIVSTPPKTENLTGNGRVKHTIETRKDNHSPCAIEIDEPKVQSPIAPQYAAVAKYFTNRLSPSIYGGQKVCPVVVQEGQLQDTNEDYNVGEEGRKSGHCREPYTMPMQRELFVMPTQGDSLPISQSREEEGTLIHLNDKTKASSKLQTPQPITPFMMVSGGSSGSENFFPPGPVPPQSLNFLFPQHGKIAYGIPPHLGGTLFLAPQGQFPMAEGTSFVNLQPSHTSQQNEGHHGVSILPGLPIEVKFPKPIKEELPTRPRERWEIKPRRPRPPTDAERQKAMDEAFEFWTPNPYVMVALKPSQVYAGFSLTLRCSALPDETRDATLVDSTGQTWMCKWLVNHSGRRLSAGWKRFAVDHLLEEGDVCVFEMTDSVNLTLLIHIFRIKLDDHVEEPIEVRKSEVRRVFADSTKRKRKSRAKPKGLGPPVPKLPAYSGCRMEKLGEISPPLRGANMLPNMPSYKYTALQSRRRPVTTEERRRAELGARNLTTKNPSVTIVMRNSSVYCHFLVSIPSAFAKQWLPRKLVRVTLMDSGGQKSTARWAGNRKKSACLKSFREFSLSHCLEEGDALVFELMDANPNNPVFLVHVFRVVELPSARMSPKDWENHYKLDVMIGTMKPMNMPLQAYQKHYDGESRILQVYQPLSSDSENDQDDQDEHDELSETLSQPATMPQLLPKSKTKAIYSALVKRKIVGKNGNSNADQYDEREAGKAIHISQLERLGRQQISCDIMPLLRRNLRIDGHGCELENTTSIIQPHKDQVDHVRYNSGTEASHLEENDVNQDLIVKPLISLVPKKEPVEEAGPPKEMGKRIRRKTTLRREGRDEFLQVTLEETTDWEPHGSHHNRQDDLVFDVDKKALFESETTACQLNIGAASRDPVLSLHQEEVQYDANAHKPKCLALEKIVADVGIHLLKPKPEPIHGGDDILGIRQEVGCNDIENGHVEVDRPSQGEGSSVKSDKTTTQYKQVFFGSIIDKVGSESGAHHSDTERQKLCYVDQARLAIERRDDTERSWQFLQPEMVVNSNANKINFHVENTNNNMLPWFSHPIIVEQAQFPTSQSQASTTAWETRREKE